MLSNLISASHLNPLPNRRYCPTNHCEYIEMAVAPSAYEAHATRTFVIEEGMQEDNDLIDLPNARHTSSSGTHPLAPPSISSLLGIGAFGLTGPHPSHMMYLAKKSHGDSAFVGPQGSKGFQGFQGSQGSLGFQGSQGSLGFQGSQGSLGSKGSQTLPAIQQNENEEGRTGENDMLMPGDIV